MSIKVKKKKKLILITHLLMHVGAELLHIEVLATLLHTIFEGCITGVWYESFMNFLSCVSEMSCCWLFMKPLRLLSLMSFNLLSCGFMLSSLSDK
jgi:hypothetical protein